jgi:hypothetical protein
MHALILGPDRQGSVKFGVEWRLSWKKKILTGYGATVRVQLIGLQMSESGQ